MGRLVARLLVGWVAATVTGAADPATGETGQLVRSEEHAPLLRPVSGKGEPWLGVSVQKPSQAIYEKLTDVPKAVGFAVYEVAAEGPAAKAGLREADFLWKLDDQLLVNEAQFLVLLHLHQVGEVVTLTFQREGENREVEVVLLERPTTETGRHLADVAIMREPPIPGVPGQIVDILRQVATIKDADGVTVRLERRGEGFHWQQFDAVGQLIQEGDVKGVDDMRFPPGTNEALARKLGAMIRAFEDAEKRAASGERSSRVRRVPALETDKERNP